MRFVSNLCRQISIISLAVGHLTGDTETHAAITFQRQIITLILLVYLLSKIHTEFTAVKTIKAYHKHKEY